MSVTCFCSVIVSILLLLSLQASSARHLGVVGRGNKDPQAQEKRLLLNLSDENDDGTKWVKAKNSVLPLKEKATSIREQQKGSITPDDKSDQDQEINVEVNKKDQIQDATKAGPLHESNNKDNIPRDHQSKMVKPQVNLSGAPNPVTVSWRLPQQKRKRRKKKKKTRGMSRDPEFTLDYAPPRVHPPCHN